MHQSDPLIVRHHFAVVDGSLVASALIAALCYADKFAVSFNLTAILATRLTVQNLLRVAAVFAIWSLLMRLFRNYSSEALGAWSEALRIAAAVLVTALLLFLSFDNRHHQGASAFHIALAFALFSFLSLCGVRALAAFLANYSGPALLGRHRVVIVGTGPRAMRTYRYLRTRLYRSHTLLGFLDTGTKSICSGEIESMYLGSLASLESYLVDHVIDEVFVALPARSCYQAIEQTVEICTRIGVRVKYPDDTFPSALITQTRPKEDLGPTVVTMRSSAHDERLIIKRLFDIVLAVLAIVLASPLLLVLAALVKLTSRGPVLFLQERYGLGRRRFKICKFRSMVDGAESQLPQLEALNEAQGPIFKIRADPRVTKFGSFLRRTSLDELPQLFNVLAGHMSFVGPRPMSVRDVSNFSEAWLMRRFSVKPGITGLWQVTGRSNLSFSRWIELDLQYIDNWSLSLDAKILALTLPAVLKGTGAM